MKVLFDVDEVIADFVGGVLDAVRDELGFDFHHDHVTQWDIRESLGFTREQWAPVQERIIAPGFASSLRPLPGAVDVVKSIASRHDVYFVTSHYRSSQTWVHERDDWLERKFGHTLGGRVVHTAHKHLIAGDVLVDDKPENVEKWWLKK